MNIIECKNLTVGYSSITLVKDINLNVECGDYLCIIGENGSGKSTLIKTILGLVKPLKGKVKVNDGKPLHIGYIPQVTEFQKDFPATVKEIVMTGFINKMGWRPFYKKSEKLKAQEIMKSLNILDMQKKSYKELSGGQQQKVLLARAMCASNEILILDEPTNGLDTRSINSLHKTLANLNKQNNLTIIMISHDLSKVVSDTTHILALKKSGYFYGKTEEFIQNELSKQYLN